MKESIERAAHRGTALLGALALSLLTVLGAASQAWAAADTPSLDFSQTGSISLTLKDADGNAVSGGTVTLYQVASLYLDDGSMAYALEDAFADFSDSLEVEDAALANSLAAYAEETGASGTQAAVGTDGGVSFEGLKLGLYLVVQTTESESYEAINPFVVTVPFEEDGEWAYAVDASPKVGTVAAVELEEEPSEPTPETTTTTETETTPATGATLPQTGQLNWPVPVLAIGGLLLVVTGLALKRTPAKEPGRSAARGGHAA